MRTVQVGLPGVLAIPLLGLLLLASPGDGQVVDRPNILLITADNLGYGDLGVYGNAKVQTPHLDRLASEGVRLTEFYTASPTCTVSRATLMTGRYPQRIGLNHQLRSEENLGVGLPQDEVLMPEYLKKEGYVTGAFGKWNLGFAPGSRPTERGFDEYYGHASGNIDFYTHIYDGRNDLYRGTEQAHVNGYRYSTDMWAEAAMDFMTRHADDPFFLYLPFNAVHYNDDSNGKPGEPNAAWQAPPEVLERYGISAYDKDEQKRYWAVVTALDEAIGRVLQRLESLGLAEETLVVFYSDNGAFMYENKGLGVASNGPLRSGGNTLWEGGIRVPAIVRWPGRVEPGTVNGEVLSSLDLLIMTLNIAGVEKPKSTVLDGKDPIPTLTRGAPSPHEHLFWEYRGMSAVREGRYKLLRAEPDQPFQLFDLKMDIAETTDLTDQRPEVAARLRRAYDRWKAEMEAVPGGVSQRG